MRISDWSSDVCSSDLPDGSTVRLSDVGRVELGAVNYAMSARLDDKPMAGMAIQLAAGANALSASRDVRAKMAELSQGFPAGIEWAEIGRASCRERVCQYV